MIKYRKGYKYQLAEDWVEKVDIIGYSADLQFIKLTPVGVLTGKSGYAWDGPSGPTIDDDTNMEGSLGHDIMYQLMRLGIIPQSYRNYADKWLESKCIEKGMDEERAHMWYLGVNLFAGSAADPKNKKKVYVIQ